MWLEDKYSGQGFFTFYIENQSKNGNPIKFYVPGEMATSIMMLNLQEGAYDLQALNGRGGKAYLYYEGDENVDMGPLEEDKEKTVDHREKISLTVGDAFPYNACSGIARMDFDSMQQIDAWVGNTIELSANGLSEIVVAVEGFPGEGRGVVFIDEIIRSRLGLQTGDKVVVRKRHSDAKINVQKALKSNIYPVTLGIICKDKQTQKMIEPEVAALVKKLKQIQKDNPGVIFVKSISGDLPFAILPILGGDQACARVMEGWSAKTK